MMAIDPVHYVAMPRALALALSMPLLSALFIAFGIGGAYLVGVELLSPDGRRLAVYVAVNVEVFSFGEGKAMAALADAGMRKRINDTAKSKPLGKLRHADPKQYQRHYNHQQHQFRWCRDRLRGVCPVRTESSAQGRQGPGH